jgi:hypothetical protein
MWITTFYGRGKALFSFGLADFVPPEQGKVSFFRCG